MNGLEAAKLYQEWGVAALFIVMFAITLGFLIRLLVKGKDKEIERTEKLANILMQNAHSMDEYADVVRALQVCVDKEARASTELLTYFRTRDDMRRQGGHE